MSRFRPDGLPIKMYTESEQTFNEWIPTVKLVDKKFFEQKYNLTSNIRDQFTDSDNKATRVSVVDLETEEEIGTKDYNATLDGDGNYRYDITFTLTELGVTDKQKVRIEVWQDDTPIVPIPTEITGDFDIIGLLGSFSGTGTVS